jgi:glycosyltransferase involved in cell wall biosynthesis
MSHQKTRLMQITHDLDLGGLQQVVVNICRTIDRDRFDVSVLCLETLGCFAPDVEELGIPVVLLEGRPDGPDYFAFRRVARVLRERQIDVIHTHNTQPFFDGALGASLAGVKTIVHTDHARSFPDKRRYMFAEWALSHLAYRVVGCSEHTSENLMKYEKISPRKIRTVPNGIDPERFNVTVDEVGLRADLGIRGSGPVMGLAVRLSDQKGITYLLKAMPAIVEVHPDVSLVIAGDGDLRADLEAESRALGLTENVFFVGPRMDIPQLLKLFDLYVLPSKWEGLPMVILEAMAAGCPVLATDVGGNYTAIDSGVSGMLVEPEKPEALIEPVNTLLADPELRRSYAAAAREKFDAEFSARIMTQRYERLYLREG